MVRPKEPAPALQEHHQGTILRTPWPDVHATSISSARHFGRHWHTTFGIGVLDHGAQASASGRGPVSAYAGDLITTNPGEVHDGRPLGGAARRWRMLYLDAGLVASMAARPGYPGGDVQLTRPVLQDAPLRDALSRLLLQVQGWAAGVDAAGTAGRQSALPLACEESLVRVGAMLVARHSTSWPEDEVDADVARVRDRLADESSLPPTLSELAAMLGLSRFQLLRRFERRYGVPPHAWLMSQRAERAQAFIARGLSLAQAAVDAGYADQAHMTRHFGRHFGYTPGAWAIACGRRAIVQ